MFARVGVTGKALRAQQFARQRLDASRIGELGGSPGPCVPEPILRKQLNFDLALLARWLIRVPDATYIGD